MPPDRAASALQARLSSFDTAMVVVSLVVGVGIFRTPSLVTSATGSSAGSLLAWTIGGAVSLVGALVFAEIGSRYPRPGGYYKVVSHCWHPMAAFLLNWAQVLMQGAGAAGVAVLGLEYLFRLAGREAPSPTAAGVLAAALVVGLTGLNLGGIRAGARAQNLLSVAKVILIAALAVAGLLIGGGDAGMEASPLAPPTGMLAALVAVFYTYGGYQNTMNLAGDVRDARRKLPVGIVAGMALVTGLYLLVNAGYLHALGPGGVAASPLVAADLAYAVMGAGGAAAISLLIFLSAAGFVNATILHVPRSYVPMAEDGLLPPALARVDPSSQAQRTGLAFFAVTILVPLALLGTFEQLLAYVIFTDALSLAVAASCLFVLRRRREGEAGQVWAMPGYPWLPAAFLAVLLAVLGHLVVRQPGLSAVGATLVLVGVPLYFVMRRAWNRPAPA